MESDSQQQNSLLRMEQKSPYLARQEEVDTALAQLKELYPEEEVLGFAQTLHQEMLLWQQLEQLHRVRKTGCHDQQRRHYNEFCILRMKRISKKYNGHQC